MLKLISLAVLYAACSLKAYSLEHYNCSPAHGTAVPGNSNQFQCAGSQIKMNDGSEAKKAHLNGLTMRTLYLRCEDSNGKPSGIVSGNANTPGLNCTHQTGYFGDSFESYTCHNWHLHDDKNIYFIATKIVCKY